MDFGEAKFILSKQFKQQLLVVTSQRQAGYCYTFHKKNKSSFACSSCKKFGKSRVVTVNNGRIMGNKHPEDDHHEFCHPIPEIDISVCEVDRNMRADIRKTGKRPREAYAETLASVVKNFKSAEEQAAVISGLPRFSAISRQLYRAREVNYRAIHDPSFPDTQSATISDTMATNKTNKDIESSSGTNSTERILMEPYNYLLQIKGKEIRTQLSLAFNHWLHIPEEKLNLVVEITQMLHNASLLIDDIEDNSDLRRGIPVAHHIYGVAHTINSANYVYFLGLQKALQLNHPEVTNVYTEQLLELHRGQGMDIYWRDAHICPTEKEYKEMVIRKTGGLFGLAVRLMQLFSDNKHDFKPLLDDMGLYFQIRDDYANLRSKELESNKGYAEDLTEGKFSFPIVYGIKSQPENNQIMSILQQRTSREHVKKYCIDYMDSIGCFTYTRQVLTELEHRLKTRISELGGNPVLESVIVRLRDIYQQ